MKQLLILVGCAVIFTALIGCQNTNKAVKVIIEGEGEFPESLVGTWKSNPHDGWEITFQPGGSISSVRHYFGKRILKPGQINDAPTRIGGKCIYEPGPWLVQYNPETGELFVEITIKHYYIEMAGGAMEGRISDELIGVVSEGKWEADWINFPEYTVFLPEPHKLPTDSGGYFKKTLIFEKVPEHSH